MGKYSDRLLAGKTSKGKWSARLMAQKQVPSPAHASEPVVEEKPTFQRPSFSMGRDTPMVKPSGLSPGTKRTISEVVRPSLEMAGGTAGSIIGGGLGTVLPVPGAGPAGAVAGGGGGYAIGSEVADLVDQWLGLAEQKPLTDEMLEAGKRVVEGAAFEAGGQGAFKVLEPVVKGIKGVAGKMLPPLSKKATKGRAGEILIAHTNEGPVIAENVAKAEALEEQIPGLKFTRGQRTGDVEAIKLERAQMRGEGGLGDVELEQKATNSQAIRNYLERAKGGGTIEDVQTLARGQRGVAEGGVTQAGAALEREAGALEAGVGTQAGGEDIRAATRAARGEAAERIGEKFESLPYMEFETVDLIKGLEETKNPLSRFEKIREDTLPRSIDDAIKNLKDDPAGISLKDAQDLSSELGKDIRASRDKHPNYLSRLRTAKDHVDDLIKTAEPKVLSPEKMAEIESWSDMRSEVTGSQTRGTTITEEGRVAYGASSPKWMENMQAAAKANGEPLFSRKEITNLIDKTRAGKPLTERQAERFRYLEDARGEFSATTAGQRGFGEAEDMIEAGFEPMAGKEISGGSLNEGDSFIGDVQGTKGTFKVEATNEGGALVVDEHGRDFEIGVFDDIKVDGLKTPITDVKGLSAKAQTEAEKVAAGRESKAAAKQLMEARKEWKEGYIQKFKQGPVSDILEKGKDGADRVQSAQIASRFFKPGNAGLDAADQFLSAVGSDPKAMKAISDYAAQDLIQSATKPISGEINEAGLKRWLKRHSKALDKFGIKDRFSSIDKARATLTKAKEFQGQFEKSATARLLNVDPEKAISKALGTDNQRMAMGELLASMKGDKAAIHGLQNSLIDHIMASSEKTALDKLGNEIINVGSMAKSLKKYNTSLKTLFKGDKEKLKALYNVRDALRTIQRNVGSPIGGGSDTFENVVTHLAKRSFTGTGKIASVVKAFMGPIKKMSDNEINRIINMALLDPEVATTIMMAARGSSPEIVSERLTRHLARTALTERYQED